jgi:hypothetical protein
MKTEPQAVLRVQSRRSYWAARGLGALAFAVVCVFALRARGNVLALALGIAGFVMFGFFALYALRQLLRRGPRLVLSPAGFEAADLGIGVVPWADVAEVQAFGSPQAPFIAFRVPDADAYLRRMPWYPRSMVRLLRASGLPMFSLNLIGVDQPAHEVVRRAERWRQAAVTPANRP